MLDFGIYLTSRGHKAPARANNNPDFTVTFFFCMKTVGVWYFILKERKKIILQRQTL